jgi:hypothetical protein
VSILTKAGWLLLNNTINDTADGITGSTASGLTALNNIISNMTGHGAKWTTQTDDNRWDYNDFYNPAAGSVDIELVLARNSAGTLPGPNDTDIDPQYTTTHSWTDLVVTHANNKVITSAAAGFSTYFAAGNYICITGGVDWTPGNYLINTVDSDGQLTLNTSPAAIDKTGGTATIVTSFKTGTNVADGFGIRQAVA